MADQLKQRTDNVLKRIRRLQIKQCCNYISEKHKPSDASNVDTLGCLLSNLRCLEQDFDSDATESSSGGESCDETPTSSKATWRWASDRCKIASTWNWIQAQVTDLEYKIRQQNDLVHQLKIEKSPIFGPPITQPTTTITTIIPSGSSTGPMVTTLPSVIAPTQSPETCARALPLSSKFRPRRLVKSTSILADAPKKTLIKYSTVPCACSSLPQSVAPCIACNGRYNCSKMVERNTTMPYMERVSLLDSCCHPVLSFPDDVPLGLRLSLLLKEEKRSTVSKNRPGRKKKSDASKDLPHLDHNHHSAKSTNINNHKYQSAIVLNKLRRKYEIPKKRKHSYSTDTLGLEPTVKRNKRDRRGSSKSESSNCASPASPQSVLNSSLHNSAPVNRRRRSEQHAYDIDNIVIPFSIAATTRVEKLEYKEIITPSWRVYENGNVEEDEIEDLSDEAYAIRHQKCEIEEKKRFSINHSRNNNLFLEESCLTQN